MTRQPCGLCSLLGEERVMAFAREKDKCHENYFAAQLEALRIWPILSTIEVLTRNSFSQLLLEKYGADFFESGSGVFEIKTPKRAVTEYPFGFWTKMVTKRYESALWAPALHKAFIKNRRMDRSQIAALYGEAIVLRNRIAHHEPITKQTYIGAELRMFDLLANLSPEVAEFLQQQKFVIFYT